MAAGWAGERLTLRAITGMVLGLAGVAVLVGWNPGTADNGFALAVAAMLGASLAYGAASVYARQRLPGVSPLAAATGQQFGAAVVLAPFGLLAVGTGRSDLSLTPEVALAILGLGLVCTSAAYLLYFRSIATVGAVKTASVTFLIPIFGIAWSALFLGESAPPGSLPGLGMIFTGVAIVSGIGIRGLLGRARLAQQRG